MWSCRFFLFKFHESPKNLLARGYKDLAVDSLNKIASFNNSDERISVEDLCHDTGGIGGASTAAESKQRLADTHWSRSLKARIVQFGPTRLKPLFATKKMGWTTIMIWFIWITIQVGMVVMGPH